VHTPKNRRQGLQRTCACLRLEDPEVDAAYGEHHRRLVAQVTLRNSRDVDEASRSQRLILKEPDTPADPAHAAEAPTARETLAERPGFETKRLGSASISWLHGSVPGQGTTVRRPPGGYWYGANRGGAVIIATFGPTTAWVGKSITFDDEQFTLEGHGPITAADVMEYDRQGHLTWATEGTRAWVGAKARPASASRTSSDASATTSSAPTQVGDAAFDRGEDRVAQALRDLRRAADVRLGAIAGAATLVATWFGTFLLGLIPLRPLGIALLSPAFGAGGPFDYQWWVPWSLLGHFGGSVSLQLSASAGVKGLSKGTYGINLVGLVPLMILVGVMLLVGVFVRRAAPATLRARFTIVVITAATMAVAAGIVTLLGGYTIGAAGSGYSVEFGVFSCTLRAFVIPFVVGAFAFGAVGLLPVPHAAALQNAARFALLPALVVALIAPLIVSVRLSDSAYWSSRDAIGLGTLLAPAAGAAFVPLSLGSQGTYGVVDADPQGLNELGASGIGGTVPTLLRSIYIDRLLGLAGRLGIGVKLAAFALLVSVLAFWVFTVRRYVGVMGAPTGVEGLWAGAYLGLVCAIAVIALAVMLSSKVDFSVFYFTIDAQAVATGRSVVGTTEGSYPYVLIVLVATGAGIGYLVGLLRPSPTRYAMLSLVGLAPATEPSLTTRPSSTGLTMAQGDESPSHVESLGSRNGIVTAPADLSASSTVDRLANLAHMRATGAITDEEFAALKAKLME
jgi:hypothetical protein